MTIPRLIYPALAILFLLPLGLQGQSRPAVPPNLPAPFGIQLGSKYGAGQIPDENDGNGNIYRLTPPNPIPMLSRYGIHTTKRSDIVYQVIGKLESSDSAKIKSAIQSLRDVLSRSYGKPTVPRLDSGNISYVWDKGEVLVFLSADLDNYVAVAIRSRTLAQLAKTESERLAR